MKSEPSVFSIEDLRKAPRKTTGWDGVRNYEARNFMKAMKKGDLAFFYHSNAEPSGIAGVVEISREAYPETKDQAWWQVDVSFKKAFPRVISLDELRAMPELGDMALFKRSRLSVQPVTAAEWKAIATRAA